MTLAAEVDAGHLRLLLEDRAHQAGQGRVDVLDLLELVEDERGAAPAAGGQLPR